MEKVAPNSNLLGILLKIIWQSKIKGTLLLTKCRRIRSYIEFLFAISLVVFCDVANYVLHWMLQNKENCIQDSQGQKSMYTYQISTTLESLLNEYP